jgi:hypothetical protein
MEKSPVRTPISRIIEEAKTPFIKVIAESVHADLLAQTSYLERRGQESADGPDAKRFMDMFDGAKTVLNILENSAIGESGTRQWLAKLDKNQLLHAQECVADLLKKKDDEDKYRIYIGRAHHLSRCFLSEDKANRWVGVQMGLVARALGKGRKGDTKPTFSYREVTFTVDPKRVLFSELNDYLEGDERVPDNLSDEGKVAFIQQQQQEK